MNDRKRKSILELNKRMLGESVINEDHEHTNEGKIEYIIGALGNLSSDDLNKIYLDVERYDPEYPHLFNRGI